MPEIAFYWSTAIQVTAPKNARKEVDLAFFNGSSNGESLFLADNNIYINIYSTMFQVLWY